MGIDERKGILIKWIKSLKNEEILQQIEGVQKMSLEDLPAEILELIRISDSEPIENCTEHTSVKDILKG